MVYWGSALGNATQYPQPTTGHGPPPTDAPPSCVGGGNLGMQTSLGLGQDPCALPEQVRASAGVTGRSCVMGAEMGEHCSLTLVAPTVTDRIALPATALTVVQLPSQEDGGLELVPGPTPGQTDAFVV